MDERDFVEKALKQSIEVTNKCLASGKWDSEQLLQKLLDIDALQEVNAYRKSEENQKNCEPFEQMNQKYIRLHSQYKNSFHDLYREVEQKASRREYAKGGASLHRGFYSPSLLDVVVRGCSRGRLLKKPPKSGNDIYEYLFDEKDQLICVYFYAYYDGQQKPDVTELFVQKTENILSLGFERLGCDDSALSFFSESHYEDGKQIQYQFADCRLLGAEKTEVLGANCGELQVEAYDYSNRVLQSLHWYRYMPSVHLLEQERYTFIRDAKGYLSAFSIERFSPGKGLVPVPGTYKVQVRYEGPMPE